jgi:hypothetical protein
MKFQPGQSGNPGGRPKVIAEVQALAREHTADAIETLATIMLDKKASAAARVSAASVLLDRGYGKALQTIETGGGTEFVVGAQPVSRDEWMARHGDPGTETTVN